MAILENDGNLDRATEVEGYKVLPPCVLYGKIGQGGMGAVYRGRHLNLDIDVAVKCLKPGLVGGDDQFVVRFRREARSAAQINHQNVIRVYDVAEDQGLHYLIMELVQGETARERVVRKQKLGIGEALEIVYGAAQGLAEAHRKGFIHRDIKPDNIMISSSGQVKVADLGLAKPSIRDDHASLLSGTNLVMGTPQYMPPEQWENTTTVTAAADVWALGATLYYLLVGGEAIQKDSLPRIMQRIMLQPFPDARKQRSDVPEDVAALIAKATSIAVEDRYQNAQELADAIEKLETRRSALKDKDAVSTSKVQNLVSPPPAKTLAKIKFWLDKHGQEVAGPPSGIGQGPGGTMVVNPGQDTVAPLAVKPNPTKWIAAAIGVVALLAVVFVLANGGKRGIFAEAERLERQGQFEAAIAEVARVQDEDPSLPHDDVRLARLRSAWARDLAVRGAFAESLVQVEHAIVVRDTPEVRKQKAEILTKVATVLDGKLVRETPGAQPVAAETATEFTGRIDDPLVVSIRIGNVPAPLQKGAFRVTLDTTGKNQVPVEVTLPSGDVVNLTPWTIVHAGKAPVLQPAQLAVTPETVQLEDDKEAEIVIRVARGATVLVDDKPQPTTDDGTLVRYRVRSTDDTPAPIVVTVKQPGFAESNKTVNVTRTSKSWTSTPLEVQGARKVQNQFVTKDATVRLVGRASERATTVLVNGSAVEPKWTDTTFELQVKLPGKGVNTLRVELQKRMRPPLQQDLVVVLVDPPTIELEPPSKENDKTAGASYTFAVKVDAWTSTVVARRGGVMLNRVDVTVGATHASLGVPLEVGVNEIELEAINAAGAKTARKVSVERTAPTKDTAADPGVSPQPVATPSGPPRITSVLLVIAGEEVAVPLRGTKIVKSGTPLRVVTTDPNATILVKDKNNVVAAADLVLAKGCALLSRGDFVELWARNASGTSAENFKFGVEFDDEAPTFEITSPTTGLGADRPFTIQGNCKDNQTVAKVTLNGVAANGYPKRKGGAFAIELPGISQPVELQLVVTDIAGNVAKELLKLAP